MPYQDGSSIVNFCIPAGSGMTGCNQAGKGWDRQSRCTFSEECTAGGKCTHEKFGEYCGNHIAHRHRAGKPINLLDIKAVADHEKLHEDFQKIYKKKEAKTLWKDILKDYIEKDSKQNYFSKEYMIDNTWKDGTDEELIKTAKIIKQRSEEDPNNVFGVPDSMLYRDEFGKLHQYVNKGWREVNEHQKLLDNKMVDAIVEDNMKRGASVHTHALPVHTHENPKHFHGKAGLGFSAFYDEEPHNHNLHENWPYKNANEAVQMEKYLFSRIISRRNITERYEVGLIIFIPSMYMLYDKEYHVYYSTEGVLKVSKSEQHLLTDFNDWKIHVPVNSVPTPATDFGWHTTAVANKLFPNTPKIKFPVDRRFPKKSVCNDCALGWKYCKNQCSKYLLS